MEDLNLNEWHSYENAAFVLFSEGYVKDWTRFADPTGSSRLETTGRTKGQFNQEKVANEHANHAKIIDLQYKNTSSETSATILVEWMGIAKDARAWSKPFYFSLPKRVTCNRSW